MVTTSLLLLAGLSQNTTPVIDASSVYGMKTFTQNAQFGFLPDRYTLAFAPANIEQITMHVLQGETELTGGQLYATETPYPAFRMLRFQQPTVELPEPGQYTIEFRHAGQPVSRFPFEIRKKAGGDEFNPTVTWQFVTPVDRMGNLTFSNSDNSHVWLNAWIAPDREAIPMGAMLKITLSHNGKTVAHALDFKVQESFNARRGFKLMKPEGQGRSAFNKSDLLALNGTVTGKILLNGTPIRTFEWTIAGGKITPHPRSAADFSPRTNYLLPRRQAGSPEGYQFFHLEEQYWTTSK